MVIEMEEIEEVEHPISPIREPAVQAQRVHKRPAPAAQGVSQRGGRKPATGRGGPPKRTRLELV